MSDGQFVLRPARRGDGQSVFDVTWLSAKGLAASHYSTEEVAGWMGERDSAYYEELISHGRMVVAEHEGVIVGFVDAEPGELTRLFVLPSASGVGLGRRLLQAGIDQARRDYEGPIRLEATLNAVGFYERHGFCRKGEGYATHTLGGPPLAIVRMEL